MLCNKKEKHLMSRRCASVCRVIRSVVRARPACRDAKRFDNNEFSAALITTTRKICYQWHDDINNIIIIEIRNLVFSLKFVFSLAVRAAKNYKYSRTTRRE